MDKWTANHIIKLLTTLENDIKDLQTLGNVEADKIADMVGVAYRHGRNCGYDCSRMMVARTTASVRGLLQAYVTEGEGP